MPAGLSAVMAWWFSPLSGRRRRSRSGRRAGGCRGVPALGFIGGVEGDEAAAGAAEGGDQACELVLGGVVDDSPVSVSAVTCMRRVPWRLGRACSGWLSLLVTAIQRASPPGRWPGSAPPACHSGWPPPGALEPVNAALHRVPVLVPPGVEPRRPRQIRGVPGGQPDPRARDGAPDTVLAQPGPDRPRRVRLIRQHPHRAQPRTPPAGAGHADRVHDRDELRRVPPLPSRHDDRQRFLALLTCQVHLRAEPAPRAAQPRSAGPRPPHPAAPAARRHRGGHQRGCGPGIPSSPR